MIYTIALKETYESELISVSYDDEVFPGAYDTALIEFNNAKLHNYRFASFHKTKYDLSHEELLGLHMGSLTLEFPLQFIKLRLLPCFLNLIVAKSYASSG